MSVSIEAKTLRRLIAIAVVLAIIVVLVGASAYTLDETKQAVIIQFGRPVGDNVTEPGLHFRAPFIQEVRRFDRRIMAWDGDPNQINTRGREFISIDSTARWRIIDPLKYLQSVRDDQGAQTRLDDIIDSAVRDRVSSMELVEIVRSKDWEIDEQEILDAGIGDKERKILERRVEVGREGLEQSILTQAQKQMPAYGIELVDVRLQRLNYVPSVQSKVFDRMIAERQRVAERYRSKGEGRRLEILGHTEKEVALILSKAERQAQITRGEADAEATRIYNEAYSADPEFFAFLRTLESYTISIGPDTTLVLGVDTPYFRFLREIGEAPPAAKAPR
ncbi:MAG: HflC protein [Phycisphaeraceae bacterium]|nr:HflC protein [Phycisphaeraceae bacterium]